MTLSAFFSLRRLSSQVLGAASLLALGACTVPPTQQEASSPATQAPAERVAAPGEVALNQGIKAYQAGQYAEAEAQLKQALSLGLSIGPDRANAHKFLAFIFCTSKRETVCAAAFRAARQADPSFALSKSEAGHPMWGPVYRWALSGQP